MQPEINIVTTESTRSDAPKSIYASSGCANSAQSCPTGQKVNPASPRSVRLAREISRLLPCALPAIALFAATSALAVPADSASVYGRGTVLQTPNNTNLPEGMQFTGQQQVMESDRFLQVESLDRSRINISHWQTNALPVTLPNGQAATAVFYGSPNYAFEQPGDATKRGFTLPEERIVFSTDPEFLRTSGLNGILHNHAFTGEAHAATLNPTEFGNGHVKGGMTTSANWMVVRDRDGKVLFEGKPATYGAQLYWDGTVATLSDAEGLQIGEGNYQTNTEATTETTMATAVEQRSRQETETTQHVVQGQRTWNTVEMQQRTAVATSVQPFQTEETTESKQTFTPNLNSLFPLNTVAILQRDTTTADSLVFKTGFQFAGDIQSAENPTLSGQLRLPIDTKRGSSSLNVLVGGAPRAEQPGQPDFYALLFTQFNTPLLQRHANGQYQPTSMVAGVRFGGGVFHVPVAAQVVTQTVTKSGVDILTERRTFNDFTTTNWGQDFTTNFTRQTTNDYVDTYRIDTVSQTPVMKDITDVVVTKTDGSTFVANDYRKVAVRRGETVSTTARSLMGSDLVASNTQIIPGTTQFSDATVLSQSTESQLVESDTTSQRVVQDVSVQQTVAEKDAWGTMVFVNPYLGNFDLASVLQPGSLLYEAGGNFVRSSLLNNVSYKDSNLYLSVGMPVWNPGYGKAKNAEPGLLTVRAYATYLPVTNETKVGAGLQLSGF